MRTAIPACLIGAAALAGIAIAPAGAGEDHTVTLPDAVAWAPGPASIPPGAEAAVLYGNPGKEGLFALRLKLPGAYHIPPHSHPKPEVVTVISGTLRLGMGETADKDTAQPLPAGSFFAFPPGMTHYVYTDEETVLQLNSVGPWSLTYVNPQDDPRVSQ